MFPSGMPQPAPTKTQRSRYVANPWMPTSTIATGVARCLADVIQTHSGTKVWDLSHVVNNQVDHARMDLVFGQNGITTFIDVATVTPVSSSSGVTAATEKIHFEQYPHMNLAPFILETTSRPKYHAKKFISSLMIDADHPSLAIRDTRPSAISKQQLSVAAT